MNDSARDVRCGPADDEYNGRPCSMTRPNNYGSVLKVDVSCTTGWPGRISSLQPREQGSCLSPIALGPSRGYSGSGPGTLALLIDALLRDITTAAPDADGGPPNSLEGLCQRSFRAGAVLTRDQLEASSPRRSADLSDLPEDGGGDNS